LRLELRAMADPARAALLRRYFKAGPGGYGAGDEFLGITVPALRKVARAYRTLPLAQVRSLLRSRWHEERLLALLVLVEQYGRGSPADRDAIYRLYLGRTRHINNWDLVDLSAKDIVGPHLDPRDVAVLERLARSKSVWERRIAVLATFRWIAQGTCGPSLRLARMLLDDPHDLIHKAVGWMLREVGNRDRATADAFLREHCRTMPRTMLRYAIEKLPEKRRREFLSGQANSAQLRSRA
jgi:3-methyladenine DNA glycosylase AlkD